MFNVPNLSSHAQILPLFARRIELNIVLQTWWWIVWQKSGFKEILHQKITHYVGEHVPPPEVSNQLMNGNRMSHQTIPQVSSLKMNKRENHHHLDGPDCFCPNHPNLLEFFVFLGDFFTDWDPMGWTSPWKNTICWEKIMGSLFPFASNKQILWIQVAWVIPEDVPVVSGSFRIERNLTYWMVELFQLFLGWDGKPTKHVAGDGDHGKLPCWIDEVRSLGSTQQVRKASFCPLIKRVVYFWGCDVRKEKQQTTL